MVYLAQEFRDPVEDIENATAALDAFGSLIRFAVESGDDLRDDAWGIVLLYRPHITALEDSARALREAKASEDTMPKAEESEHSSLSAKALRDQFIAEQAKAGIDPGEIAQAINQRKSLVERVIGQLRAGETPIETSPRAAAVNG